MYNRKSVYGKNKMDREAIVCPTAIGKAIRLTHLDFSSKEEFAKWKNWSDADYYSRAKEAELYSKRTVSLHLFSERIGIVIDFDETWPDEMHFDSMEEIYDWFSDTIQCCLTRKEQRRFWYYIIEGLSMKKIAQIENVRQQSIYESLATARKKFNKYLRRTL